MPAAYLLRARDADAVNGLLRLGSFEATPLWNGISEAGQEVGIRKHRFRCYEGYIYKRDKTAQPAPL